MPKRNLKEHVVDTGKSLYHFKQKRIKKKLSEVKVDSQEGEELLDMVVTQLQKQVPEFREEIRQMIIQNTERIHKEQFFTIGLVLSLNVVLDDKVQDTQAISTKKATPPKPKDKIQMNDKIDPAYL